jgi:phosphoglycolate phosphatase-like HAD superfamily hydrolase
MHLVLFDIDGTLTQTNAVDDACFIRAVREVLGICGLEPDWSRYPHVTDWGITAELIRRTRGQEPRAGDVESVRDQFVSYLAAAIAADPSACRAVAGGGRLLREIASTRNTSVALATGGWGKSARMKLRAAGLAVDGIAFASSDDAMAREQIMRVAVARAAEGAGVAGFESCVYVGDGPWDLRAARALGFAFVGIAEGQRAIELAAGGASAVFADFIDTRGVLQALLNADG